MKNIAVLMSTYNGEKYIREQIESILSQKGVEICLYIRDDGSDDNTISIIEDFKKNHHNIVLKKGKNVGVGNSFMNMVYEVPEFEYYAFSDQDDIWLPEKLYKAIERIDKMNTPCLYASNQMITDEYMNPLGKRFQKVPDISFKQIMTKNSLSGCTMVWNQPLQKLLSDINRRPDTQMLKSRIHDVWVAMVASVTGIIIFDVESYMQYRQHQQNVVGVDRTPLLEEWKKKLLRPEIRNGRSLLCKEIRSNYSDVIESEEILSVMNLFGDYKRNINSRFRLIKHGNFSEYTGENKLSFAIKVLLGLV